MDSHDSEDPKQNTADMTAFQAFLISWLYHLQQSRFQTMSESIIAKNILLFRIDELEQSINDLRSEMGIEGSASPSLPSKSNDGPDQGNQ
ncbi:Heat shock factor-binding protein [Citrus sinensis]|uniref:Heat shock factor-binding protein n=1 Tax=Citrus sinensis TaxID=2711 RepID=A0ACB8I8N2_CITSI|nr:Heat shock factor-binding protein [Citrus sinensis]